MELKENGIYIAKVYDSIIKIQILEITESSVYFENLDTEEHKKLRIKKGSKFFSGKKTYPVLNILEDLSPKESTLIPKQLLKG